MINRLKLLSNMSGMQKPVLTEDTKSSKDMSISELEAELTELEKKLQGESVGSHVRGSTTKKGQELRMAIVKAQKALIAKLEIKKSSLDATTQTKEVNDLIKDIARIRRDMSNGLSDVAAVSQDQSSKTKLNPFMASLKDQQLADAAGTSEEFIKSQAKKRIEAIEDNIATLNKELGNPAVANALREIRAEGIADPSEEKAKKDAAIKSLSINRSDLHAIMDSLEIKVSKLTGKIKSLKKKVSPKRLTIGMDDYGNPVYEPLSVFQARLKNDPETVKGDYGDSQTDTSAEVAEKAKEKESKKDEAAELTVDLRKASKKLKFASDLKYALEHQSELEAATNAFNARDLRKQSRIQRDAERKLKGLSRAEDLDTGGLEAVTSLVYKEDPSTQVEPAVNFSSLKRLASGLTHKKKEFAMFDAAMPMINTNLSTLATTVLNDNPSFRSNKVLLKVFNSIRESFKPNRGIERNSDLIKLCWLYLAGDDVLQLAKDCPEFVDILETLEASATSPVTNPIANINTVADIIADSESDKDLQYQHDVLVASFDGFKGLLGEEYLMDTLVPNVTSIISATKELATNPSANKEYNAADTLWYAIINAFASPEEKQMLIKNSGRGTVSSFLSPKAMESVDIQKELITSRNQAGKALPSRSHKSETEKSETQHAVIPQTRAVDAEELDPVETELNLAMDYGNPGMGKGIFTGVLDTHISNRLRELFSQKGGKQVTAKKLADVLKANFAASLGRVGGPEAHIEALENSIASLGTGVVSLDAKEAQKKKEVLTTKLDSLKKVVSEAKKQFAGFLSGVEQLTTADLEVVSRILAYSKPTSASKDVSISDVSAISDEGKALTKYAANLLSVVKEKIEEKPAEDSAADDSYGIAVIEDKIEGLQGEIRVMRDRIAKLDEKQKAAKTKADKKAVQEDQNKLTVELLQLKEQEKSAREDLAQEYIALAKRPSKSTPDKKSIVGRDKLKAELVLAQDALESFINGSKETVNIDQFESILNSRVPDTVLNSVAPELKLAANLALTGIHSSDTSKQEDEVEEWYSGLRTVLSKLNKHINTSEMKKSSSEARLDALTRLTNPIREQLRVTSDAYWHGLTGFEKTSELDKLELNKRAELAGRVGAEVAQVLKTLGKQDPTIFQTKEEILKGGLVFVRDGNFYGIPGVSPDSTNGQLIVSRLESLGFERASDADIKDLPKDKLNVFTSGSESRTALKTLLKTQSIVPGTALSGSPKIVRKEELPYTLYKKNLVDEDGKVVYEEKARRVYEKLITITRNFNLSKANADMAIEEDPAFIDALWDVVAFFKENLSVTAGASTLENELFLQDLAEKAKVSLEAESDSLSSKVAVLDKEEKLKVRDILVQNPVFKDLLEVLAVERERGSFAWPTKVEQAPVIDLGAGGSNKEMLGLRSATLLNLMSCIKSFKSLDAFDLSLNKGNEDVLSAILNTDKYPAQFRNRSAMALFMKLYFMITLQNAVTKVNVIEQFKEKFLNITVQDGDEVSAEKVKVINEKLKELNEVFEARVVSEFERDFSDGGTLEKAITSSLALLQTMSSAFGGSIEVFRGSKLVTMALPEEGLREFVAGLGKDFSDHVQTGMAGMFRTAVEKSDSSLGLQKMLRILLNEDDEELLAELNNSIAIIKSGLNYSCGYAVAKISAHEKAYDPILRKVDPMVYEEELNDFLSDPSVVAFAKKFTTAKDTNETVEDSSGFENLNNKFLASFTKNFTYEALTNAIAGADVDELVNNHEDSFSSEKEDAEIKSHAVVLLGIYEKTFETSEPHTDRLLKILDATKQTEADQEAALEAEDLDEAQKEAMEATLALTKTKITEITKELNSLVKDPKSAEGKAILDRIKHKISSGTKALANGNIIPGESATLKPNAAGNLGLQIRAKRTSGFVNVTVDTQRGYKEGQKTGELSGGHKQQFEIKPFGSVIGEFADGMKSIATILAATYSFKVDKIEGQTISERLLEYSKGLNESVKPINAAIDAIKAGPFVNEEIQDVAIGHLLEIKAIGKPKEVSLLSNPTTAISRAKKMLSKSVSKDSNTAEGEFFDVSKFAEFAAADIIAGKTDTATILATLNSLLKQHRLNPAELTATRAKDGLETMSGEAETAVKPVSTLKLPALLSLVGSFFSPAMTATTTKNKLAGIKNSLGDLSSGEARVLVITKEIEALKVDQAARIKASAADKAKLGTLEAKPKDERTETDIEYLRAKFLNNTKELATTNDKIKAKTKELEDVKKKVPDILIWLTSLYAQADRIITNYKPATGGSGNVATKFNFEIGPLKTEIPVILTFIADLSKSIEGGHEEADNLFRKFGNLLHSKIPKLNSIADSIAYLAVQKFNDLLSEANKKQEVAQELNTEEAITARIKEINKIKAEIKAHGEKQPTETKEAHKARIASESPEEVKARFEQLRALNAELEVLKTDLVPFTNKFNLTDKAYIITMAHELLTKHKLARAENLSVNSVAKAGAMPKPLPVISGAIEAAVLKALEKNDDFTKVNNALNSKLHLGFLIDPTTGSTPSQTAERIQAKVQVSDFYAIKKFAEHDMTYIEAYLKTQETKEAGKKK